MPVPDLLAAVAVLLQCGGFLLTVVDLAGKVREVRRRQRLSRNVTIHVPSIASAEHFGVMTVTTTGPRPTLAERTDRLEHVVAGLTEEIAATGRRSADEAIAYARAAVEALRTDMERADKATAEYVEQLGVGDYRVTAVGIALFVVGTVLGALPLT